MVKFQGDTMTIKDKYLRILSCLVILLLGLSLVPSASASSPPTIPNVFEGNLYGDAANAGPGITISAYIDSELVGSNTLKETGKYKVTVSGTEKYNGKAITFKLGGVASEPVSVTYKHGALPAKLDLTFNGDFIPPIIETLSASPIFILNDGKDFSAVTAKVVDPKSSTPSVTIDLTPIGQGVVSLKLGDGNLYTCNVNSTVAGEFKLAFAAAYPSGSSDKESISITVLRESELATRFGGADGVFSPEEIKTLVNDNNVSSGIKYAVLRAYFADGWDRILCAAQASAGSSGRAFPSSVTPNQEFQVTVNVADYGAAGQVLEMLPAGFTFVGSNLPERAVTVNGSNVSFLLMNEKSLSYTLKAPASTGTYKIVGLLRDINKAEFAILPADCSITVSQPSSSDSGGSSSGGHSSHGSSSGGGAGGSPEPQSNVASKELSQKSIIAGTHVKFEFPKGTTCIRYVEFDAKKNLGKITTVVEMLKGQSKLVSSLPEGTVYKNVNIWVGSGGIANPDNIENASVGFRVEKTWLEKCGDNAKSLALWHYDKTWSKLETKEVGEDNTYVFFDAKTPGFGPFTIVVPNENVELNPSDLVSDNSPIPEVPKSNLASDSEKPSDEKSSIPGFESVAALGVLGAVYQILRRK